MNTQRGFTLIELVMVIVILGILSAFAIPKYIDLKNDAAQAAVNGVAGALGAAMATNFAGRTIKGTSFGVPVSDCNTPAVLATGALPPTASSGGDYVISDETITAGETASCILTFTPTNGAPVTATFTGMGIS